MKSAITTLLLGVALTLTLLALPAFAQEAAAPDPTGTWNVEVDMGGTPLMATLTVVKNDDGTYGGTLNSPMGPMSLEKVDYKPGESISFSETVGEGDTAISFTFEGKFTDADHFEGKLVSETMGEMMVKGARGKPENPLAGVWNVTSDSQLGKLERKLVIYKNSSGKYISEDAQYNISNLAVNGDAVEFDVTVSAQGQDLPLHFVGKHAAGALNGNFRTGDQDVATVTGSKATVDVVGAAAGTWDLEAETPLGPYAAKLHIGPGATGKLVSAEGESPLENLGSDGDLLAFDVGVLFQGETYNVSFAGTPNGEEMAGDFIMDGNPVATVVCKKSAS